MRIVPRHSPIFLVPIIGFVTLLVGACSDSAEAPTEPPTQTATTSRTPTPTATATPTPTPTLPAVSSVRELDFSDPLVIGPLVDAAGGGEVNPGRVVYEDLTGDAVEEAVAIVESGGTQGDIGFGVYSVGDTGIATLLFVQEARGRVEVRLGVIVAIEGVYAPGDPECCPSLLREITFRWDGAGFSRVSEQVIDNPA